MLTINPGELFIYQIYVLLISHCEATPGMQPKEVSKDNINKAILPKSVEFFLSCDKLSEVK